MSENKFNLSIFDLDNDEFLYTNVIIEDSETPNTLKLIVDENTIELWNMNSIKYLRAEQLKEKKNDKI